MNYETMLEMVYEIGNQFNLDIENFSSVKTYTKKLLDRLENSCFQTEMTFVLDFYNRFLLD